MRVRPIAFATLAFLAAAPFAAVPAFAQSGNGAGGAAPNTLNSASQRTLRGAGQAAKREIAPPVLPGTKNASEVAAPSRNAADMNPTEALFDAINRGDLEGSRGAVNRGANLAAQNELGLTPVDLSVDLGRNDISLMLLSQRGDDARTRRAAGADSRDDTVLTRPARRGPSVVSARSYGDSAPEPSIRYSGGGGAPVPSAGFLGFNGR